MQAFHGLQTFSIYSTVKLPHRNCAILPPLYEYFMVFPHFRRKSGPRSSSLLYFSGSKSYNPVFDS